MIQLLIINDKSFAPGTHTENGYEFEVTVSETPLHAFNSIIHISPDAIVLNMINPEMDGWQVLQRIRNMQASREVPVLLFVTAEDEPEFRRRYENDPHTDYYVAPVSVYETFDWAAKAIGAAHAEQKKTILVVDDDLVVLDLMKLYLGAKYKVITLNSAGEALAKLNLITPDIIMLDIAMPDMDGKELYRAIRTIPECAEIPILFQTGMAGINTVRECVKLGAAGFVIKPIQKPVLLERIEETLNPLEKTEPKSVYVFEEFDFLYTLINGFLKDKFTVTRGESILQSLNHMEEVAPRCIVVDYDNSAYILNRIREKSEELKIPIVLLSRDTMSKQVLAEISKRNTYITGLPLNKEALISTINGIGVWQED